MLPNEGEKQYIIMLDDIIRFNLDKVFSMFSYTKISAHMIKITRDAELDMDNDLSKSFIEKIYESVEERKISDPVRFVYDMNIEKDTLKFLKDKMKIEDTDSVIPGGRYHNRRDYMSFPSLEEPIFNTLKQHRFLLKGCHQREACWIILLKKISCNTRLTTPSHILLDF